MRVDIKLLRKIQKHISEEPRRFAMGVVTREGEPGERIYIPPDEYNAYNRHESQKFPECGTMACIMGWGEILGGRKAADKQMWDKLCSASAWPKQFRLRYARAKRPSTRAKISVERIEHFIQTKGKE